MPNQLSSGTLVIEMPNTHDEPLFDKSTNHWPSFPAPPTGTDSGGRLLFGVAYFTTAAIYIESLFSIPGLRQTATWISFTILFILFALSIYVFSVSFRHFGKRLGVLLFQISLVFSMILIGGGKDSLPILFFIVVPIAYLSFSFIQASALTLLCLGALFSSSLIVSDIGEALSQLLPYGGGFAFFAVVSTALNQQQKDRQRAEHLLVELENTHAQLRTYAAQIEALTVAEERNRLAREIHDSLGHYLTAMTMHLQAAGKLVAKDPQRAAKSIVKAEEMARESLSEVRRSVVALRTSPMDNTTLGETIGKLVQNLNEGGLATTFTIKGKSHLLPIQTKTALFRAAQEGFTNVRKHAHASSIEVELVYEPDQITLTITDNGTGKHNQKVEGFGLLGLGERATQLGGSMNADNNPDGGFQLHFTIPLQVEE